MLQQRSPHLLQNLCFDLTLWMFKNKQVLLILITVHGGNLRVAKCNWSHARILYVIYHAAAALSLYFSYLNCFPSVYFRLYVLNWRYTCLKLNNSYYFRLKSSNVNLRNNLKVECRVRARILYIYICISCCSSAFTISHI